MPSGERGPARGAAPSAAATAAAGSSRAGEGHARLFVPPPTAARARSAADGCASMGLLCLHAPLIVRPRDPAPGGSRALRARRRAALPARRHGDRRAHRHARARRARARRARSWARSPRCATSSPTGRRRRSRGCTAPGETERAGRDRRAGAVAGDRRSASSSPRCVRGAGRTRSWPALGGGGETADLAARYLRLSALGLPFALVALAGIGLAARRSTTCARRSSSSSRATSSTRARRWCSSTASTPGSTAAR